MAACSVQVGVSPFLGVGVSVSFIAASPPAVMEVTWKTKFLRPSDLSLGVGWWELSRWWQQTLSHSSSDISGRS